MKFLQKKYAWAAVYGLILTAFTVYVLLNAFVIQRSYAQVAEIAAEEKPADSGDAVVTEDSYIDSNVSIALAEYRVDGTSVYIADVTLKSADALRTALAQGAYGRNIKEATNPTTKGISIQERNVSDIVYIG